MAVLVRGLAVLVRGGAVARNGLSSEMKREHGDHVLEKYAMIWRNVFSKIELNATRWSRIA